MYSIVDWSRQWQDSRKTEVAKFHLTVRVYEYVSWFDVTMKNVTGMYKVNRTKSVVKNCNDMLLVEVNLLGTIEYFLKVRLNKLHD